MRLPVRDQLLKPQLWLWRRAATFVGRRFHRACCLVSTAPTHSRPSLRCGAKPDEGQHACPHHTIDVAKHVSDRVEAGLYRSLPVVTKCSVSVSSTAASQRSGLSWLTHINEGARLSVNRSNDWSQARAAVHQPSAGEHSHLPAPQLHYVLLPEPETFRPRDKTATTAHWGLLAKPDPTSSGGSVRCVCHVPVRACGHAQEDRVALHAAYYSYIRYM